MRILGIHDGHNASACLLVDGKITHAVQEERFTNIKNVVGFPTESIKYILADEKIAMEDIDCVAWSSKYMGRPFEPKKIIEAYKREYSDMKQQMRLKIIQNAKKYMTGYYEKRLEDLRKERIKAIGKFGKPKEIIFVDHHLCHAAAAYYGSGTKEDMLVLTLDGGGDDLCSTVYKCSNGEMTKIAETPVDHSIGNIYSRITFMLGFVPLEHEYKLMGMAPYPNPKHSESSYKKFEKYLDISQKDPLTFKRKINTPTSQIYPVLRRDMEFERFDNLSAGLQNFTEDLIVRWVTKAMEKTGITNLGLSGGVFMNVKANKRILELPKVKNLFIVPSCGDESNPFGAVYWVYREKMRQLGAEPKIGALGPLYLGPDFGEAEIQKAMDEPEHKKYGIEKVSNMSKAAAELLAKGEIVARCSGRTEFGARALGNRSILADPSRLECVRTINRMVKCRDFWMPFAPVIMKEHEKDYILNPKRVAAPYMILSFDTTERREELVAAIHQADQTARPQVIEKGWNQPYHGIIDEFEKLTGRGGLLNTSFNLHGYPIVNGPKDALWVFDNSSLTHLILGNHLITK